MQAESLHQCSLIISDMTENNALIKSAFLNSVTSHVVIRHVQSQLSDSLSICSACRSGSMHICPQTKVNFGNCSWLHQFSTCRKKRGRHPSWDACVGAPGESLCSVSLQIMAAQQRAAALLCNPVFAFDHTILKSLLFPLSFSHLQLSSS